MSRTLKFEGDNELNYSPSPPSASYETGKISSIRNNNNHSLSKSLISPPILSRSPIEEGNNSQQQQNKNIPSNLGYVAYAVTKNQVSILLKNELQHRRGLNKMIDQRLIEDQRTFKNIEDKLNGKIKKYQQRMNKKLENSFNKEKQDKNEFINDINNILDEIIDLDEKTLKVRQSLWSKKWYDDRNAIYRTISENNAMLTDIDSITQKIDYWQQMIAATEHRMNNPNTIRKEPETDKENHDNITPFVLKEVLRIKAQNEKTLTDLRAELDKIRANKQK